MKTDWKVGPTASSLLRNLVLLCGTGFQPVNREVSPVKERNGSRTTGRMPVPHFFNGLLERLAQGQ